MAGRGNLTQDQQKMILAIFVAMQAASGTITMSEVMFLGVAGIAANGLIVWSVTAKAAAKFEGAVGEHLKTHDREIGELKQSKTELWNKVNGHSETIAALKATTVSKAHHA